MENEKQIVYVEQLSLTIGKETLLKDINVTFEQGKIYGIIGRNGSGKTLLFKCICGYIKPTTGHVFVNGKEIHKDIDFPDNTGMIIETPGFIANDSGYMNLKHLADIRKRIDKKRICESMLSVGLDPNNKKPVKKYSLGMRQRLGLAQAIMEDPILLVLDEPMNGLDNEGVEDMRKYLLHWKSEGKTILLASHNKEDIQILCDVVYEMNKGKLTQIN